METLVTHCGKQTIESMASRKENLLLGEERPKALGHSEEEFVSQRRNLSSGERFTFFF